MEGAESFPRYRRAVGLVGFGQRLVGEDGDDGVDRTPDVVDPADMGLDHLARCDLAFRDRGRQLGRTQSPELVRHRPRLLAARPSRPSHRP